MTLTAISEQRQVVKRQIIEHIKQGASVQEARTAVGVSMHRATVYRLLRRTQSDGEAAFSERRHGHPSKLRDEVRTFLIEFCRVAPSVASPRVQTALQEHFGITLSVSQINRVRAALGLRRADKPREKRPSTPPLAEPIWQEGAGGLLLLAAATETNLIAAFTEAVSAETSPGHSRRRRTGLTSQQMLLLTLLFLGVVGLRRTWDLRSYTGEGLALLTGRKRAYGYRYPEDFLASLVRTNAAERLTTALASWTKHLWDPMELVSDPSAAAFYIDSHRKPVYSDILIPRGLVGRLSTVLGCRALVLLHDAQGHPLLATTHRGDLHLTAGLPSILVRYERSADSSRIGRVIVDREGMATEFLATLKASGRTIVTVLRNDQYVDLASFQEVGPFLPLRTDEQGTVLREVAPACIALPLPDHPGKSLRLCVALIRDLCRQVPVLPSKLDADCSPPVGC